MDDKNRTLLGFGTQNAPADEPQPLADDEIIELDSPKRALDAIVPRTKAPAETFSRHFLGISLLVAIMFVPLSITRFFEAFDGPHVPWGARFALVLPALAEGAFCIVMFDQL